MLKALFLDMDETLCDTKSANQKATALLAQAVANLVSPSVDGQAFAEAYVAGIYRRWDETQRTRYLPIAEHQGERAFRLQLIRDLLSRQGFDDIAEATAGRLQDQFDSDRINAFGFYPGIAEFLTEARKYFTLVVITNGPEYSQIPKIQAVGLADYVDHIIIGGQEPEQKPAASIFEKALGLAGCKADEAIHVGDSLATDIAGANNSGITSVWIRHQQPLDAELGINPHHSVLHPSEVPDLINRLHPR